MVTMSIDGLTVPTNQATLGVFVNEHLMKVVETTSPHDTPYLVEFAKDAISEVVVRSFFCFTNSLYVCRGRSNARLWQW